MPHSPAETIRAYLDQNGRETRVPFHNLLTTWQIERADETERERMGKELANAGLRVEPPLTELAPDDEVLVQLPPPSEDEPAAPTSAPPWEAEPESTHEDESPPGLESRWMRWVNHSRHDLIGFVLVALSGALAAGGGYLLGKGL